MKLLSVAYKYLKRYPFLVILTCFFIATTSFFEGLSFGMLIPFIQSMILKTADSSGQISVLKYLNIFISSINQAHTISFIFMLLFFLILLKNIFLYVTNVLIAKLRFGIVRNLSVNLMDNLVGYDLKYFDNAKTGQIISIINTETVRIGDFILSVLQVVMLAGKIFAYASLLFLISWKVSIFIFPLIATVLMPIEIILRKIKKLGLSYSQAIIDYNHRLSEILGGIRLIKASVAEDLEKNNFKIYADRIYYFSYKNNKYLSSIIPFSETFIFGIIAFSFLLLLNIIKIDMANTFPFVATYLLVLAKMLTQLNALNSARSEAVNRLSAFRGYEEASDTKDKKIIKEGDKRFERLIQSIDFKNVSFSYAGGNKVLSNLSIRIPRGKITAIIGASGVGKSTIANLILRFYDVTCGEILVDGINLKDFKLRDWRKNIGLVSQDTFIFNASVRENISYGNNKISVEEVIEAAKAADAHDFILSLAQGYQTILGDRGVKLSGGQKQRISIARAIIRNPEILILDEATSSLDTQTEKLIKEALGRLTTGRTVVSIAHRLFTIMHADNIVVLEEGSVVENGCHSDLIRKNGAYKRLFDMQFIMHNEAKDNETC